MTGIEIVKGSILKRALGQHSTTRSQIITVVDSTKPVSLIEANKRMTVIRNKTITRAETSSRKDNRDRNKLTTKF